MKRKTILILLIGALILMAAFSLFFPKYKVDYDGSKAAFVNARDSYRPGTRVRLRVPLATDTDYHFSVEGVAVDQNAVDNGALLEFSFTMPAHDIRIDYSTRNSMISDSGILDPEKELLADWYHSAVAVVGDASYSELTLTRCDDFWFVHVYTGSSDAGTTETHEIYWADSRILDEILEVVKEYGMEHWNGEQGVALDGAVTVVKFPGPDGSLIRVSTENMPENGEAALAAVHDILSGCVSEDRRFD